MTTSTRVLFLAVDAGDKDLILEWAGKGILPTFRRLLEEAAWSPTENPVGLFVGAIWPSFWTGLSPGQHGRYCFSQIRTGTYDHYHVTPRDTRGEPFWDALSAAGRRVAVFDVPKTAPSSRIQGIQIVDWGTHDPESGFSTWPPALAGEIASRFGPHPVRQCDEFLQRGPAEYAALRDALIRGVQKKEDVAGHLLEREDWDLFLTVFAESHCAGHQFWHLHDPTHPRHDPALARQLGNPLQDVYVALDAAIGRLLARAGAGATVFVLASHGMGPHYDATFLLDQILRRLTAPPEVPRSRRALARVAEAGWRSLPPSIRARLRPMRRRVKEGLADAVTHPELSSLLCFSTPNNDVYGGIRINLAGREPFGRIRPGAEYEELCASLTRDLLAFVNADTGEPLVRRVLRTADLYRGDRLRDLPDLMVEWNRRAPVSAISSPKTGTIRGSFPGRRTGDHKPEGLCFVLGPGVAPGPLSRRIHITDFAPTFAALLDAPPPRTDGEPVSEIVAARGGAAAAAPAPG